MKKLITLLLLMASAYSYSQASMRVDPKVINGVAYFYVPSSDNIELAQRLGEYIDRTNTGYGGFVWNYHLAYNDYILRFEYSRHACALPGQPSPCPDSVGEYYIVIRTPNDSSRVISFRLDPDLITWDARPLYSPDGNRPPSQIMIYDGEATVWQYEGEWALNQYDVVNITATFEVY